MTFVWYSKWFDTPKDLVHQTEHGDDVFVHHTAITGTDLRPYEGQRVKFDVTTGPKGQQASNVEVM